MKNILKSLFVVLACSMTSTVWAASIYKTDFVKEPTGASTTFEKGEFTSAPSWATGYSSCFHTTGSAGAVTITFSTPIDLSAYTNRKLLLAWGAESNRPVTLSINGGTATEIDKVANSSDRSKVRIVTVDLSATSITSLKFAGSGGGNSYYMQFEITGEQSGPAPKSNDATLSDLKVDGETIDGFAPTKTDYNYSVAATATVAPVVSATKNDSKASDPQIQQPALPEVGTPTTATVSVTAEDGETTLTYTVTFTRAELSHDATLKEIKVDGVAISGFDPSVETYNVSVPYSQTTIPVVTATANNSGAKPLQITPATAVPGEAKILVTAEDGTTQKTYTVTFTRAAASTDATLKALTYNGTSVPGFNATKTEYNVELAQGSAKPVVAAETTHPFAKAVIEQPASTNGTATIDVTAEDNHTTKQYIIHFTEVEGPPVPSTDLDIHMTEVYEARSGYGTDLTVFDGREYEVYFVGRDGDSKAGLFTKDGTQINTGTSDKELKVEWLSAKSTDGLDGSGRQGADEFAGATGRGNLKMRSGDEMLLHIKGFDQFTLWAKDNNVDPAKDKYLRIYVNDVEQEVKNLNASDGGSLRRYDIAPGEQLIKVKVNGDGTCKPYGFSLRVAQQPSVKHLKGNDSTQVVLQTLTPKPVYYFTKYNSLGETKIVWDGQEGTGFELTVAGSNDLGDTLVLGGKALCQTGEYNFRVASFYNGVETKSVPGKIFVSADIKALGLMETEAYQNEKIDRELKYSYHALSADAISIEWKNGNQPEGIVGSGADGVYTIGGTPTQQGEFEFTISVQGGNSLEGKIIVLPPATGDVLYLYKHLGAYNNDGVFNYLKEKGYDLVPRNADENGPRSSEIYAKYKWILISEDADADNKEVLAVMREGVNLPVLNMKSFSYSPDRLDWGQPDNGSLTDEGRFITVQRDDHPIFKALNKHRGDRIQVLEKIEGNKGLMPGLVTLQGTHCLATALTRSIEDYNADGELQTFLHEIPATWRGGKKYICMPIALSSSNQLTDDGKKLLKAVVQYLLDDQQSTVSLVSLQISGITIEGVASTEINHTTNTITFDIDITEHPDLDLTAVVPDIALESEYAHVIDADKELDLSKSYLSPVPVVVTDYINRRVYDIIVHTYSSEGLDEVYAVGQWVNIFDIYGRKVATTTENIFTMSLPHGVYLIVNEEGKTAKILK